MKSIPLNFGYIKTVYFMMVIMLPLNANGQAGNHWSRNFNEESSLLSGAVVGGGAGASAIFYNPASISEIEESELSLNASLFSIDFLNAKNALGDSLNFESSRGFVIPRFFSYILKSKKHLKWSFELAYLNNANFLIKDVNVIDTNIDVLKNLPGTERYHAFSNYENKYRDDYFGFGASYKLSEKLFVGSSMFASYISSEYYNMLQIEAGQINDNINENSEIQYFTASYEEQDFVKYNDYRLLWKFGLLYKKEMFSVGINITTPSVGRIYSDGKRVMRKRSQSNITNPVTGEPLQNYLISDYAEKKEVEVNTRSPLSIAMGFTTFNKEKTKILYTTIEYFAGIDPYKVVQAQENPNLASGNFPREGDYNDWLTYVDGAKPILNIAMGFRWIIKENFMLLTGFRTDFNYKKNIDLYPFAKNQRFKDFTLNKYHLNGGLTVNIFGHSLISGIQYSFGYEKDQQQFVNLTEPVEFNPAELKPLQGTRHNIMTTISNSVSFYLGATINLSEKDN